MARKLAWVLALGLLAAPSFAADLPAALSGVVSNSSGVPQMGAQVEVLSASMVPVATAFTGSDGRYSVPELAAGLYYLKVSAPAFLPSLREDVSLKSGANLVVNITLNTLFEAMQWTPVRRRGADDDDGWKWNLREMANRPILRILDDDAVVASSNKGEGSNHTVKGRLAFLAGSEADGAGGASDMATAFSVETSLFATGVLAFDGDVNYGAGSPNALLRARYSYPTADGSEPTVTVTARRFATPELALHGDALNALSVSLADNFTVMNFVDVKAGAEVQTIQFMSLVSAVRPFGQADVHLTTNTVLEYRYASSQPSTRDDKGFDSAPAGLSESDPRVSLNNWVATIEHAHHHELSLSERVGANSFQLAVYNDRVSDPSLTGVGDVDTTSGNYLPDIYSGTFSYLGHNLSTTGVRAVAQRKLASDLTATVDYAYGGVLEIDSSEFNWIDPSSSMRSANAHALAGKLAGHVPGSKTSYIVSYRWTSRDSLTPVDWFNASPGMADPYLNVFLRQPVPFMQGHMEGLFDLRNLLAQGYIPVVAQDGRTMYLVQAARALRGGVEFTF
jgi:hypothetical protein